MEQIDSSQIHLWLAFPDEITDPVLLDEYRRLLSRCESRQRWRFCFEREQHRYLVTRALVRTVLSKYADIAPQAWTFAVNAHGRPSIAAEHMAAAGLEFNVSHTDGMVVLGVTRGRALGVDVENVCAREVDLEIADRYFAPAEVAALRALPREQQAQRFFVYWTLKESYIKARGLGLAIALDRFAFDLAPAGGLRLTLDARLGDVAERWCFWQFAVTSQHLLAVCALRANAGPQRVVARAIVPPANEQPRDLSPLRMSL